MITKDPFYQNSLCRNSYLHRFEIKEEYQEGVKEVCEICGMSKFFKLIDGKLNNAEYMSYHIHNILPSFHPRYAREYEQNPLRGMEIESPYYE